MRSNDKLPHPTTKRRVGHLNAKGGENMKHRPNPLTKPLCPLLCMSSDYAIVCCQEERCAWYNLTHGCAVNALSTLEDIAATK